MDPDEIIKYVNCAGCGAELLGKSTPYADAVLAVFRSYLRPRVMGRIRGRPYCGKCLDHHQPPDRHGIRPNICDISPWQENAIRILERDQ